MSSVDVFNHSNCFFALIKDGLEIFIHLIFNLFIQIFSKKPETDIIQKLTSNAITKGKISELHKKSKYEIAIMVNIVILSKIILE